MLVLNASLSVCIGRRDGVFLSEDISYYKAQVKIVFIIPFTEPSLLWVEKKKKE